MNNIVIVLTFEGDVILASFGIESVVPLKLAEINSQKYYIKIKEREK